MLTDDQLTDLATLHLAAKQDGDTWDMLPLLRAVAQAQAAAEREQWRAAVLYGHIYEGSCPDERQPNARDEQCPLCVLLGPNAVLNGSPEAQP